MTRMWVPMWLGDAEAFCTGAALNSQDDDVPGREGCSHEPLHDSRRLFHHAEEVVVGEGSVLKGPEGDVSSQR